MGLDCSAIAAAEVFLTGFTTDFPEELETIDVPAQAARKEDVLSTLSQMATRFRTRVGESLATIEKYSTPLEEMTTSSLEALQAFSAGWKRTVSTGSAQRSLPHYQPI